MRRSLLISICSRSARPSRSTHMSELGLQHGPAMHESGAALEPWSPQIPCASCVGPGGVSLAVSYQQTMMTA